MQKYQETNHLPLRSKPIDILLNLITASAMLLLSISFLDWLCF